jgi:hypothetical protein
MHNAAGGTSQRLKPAVAMTRSRSRRPGIAPAGMMIKSRHDWKPHLKIFAHLYAKPERERIDQQLHV